MSISKHCDSKRKMTKVKAKAYSNLWQQKKWTVINYYTTPHTRYD